jgi:ADP-ribose pyrophosphatase YjhB (NUDIX family)
MGISGMTESQADQQLAPNLVRPATVRRHYPDAPIAAVAAAVFDGQGRVLLVRRARPPRAGQWGLPGGVLDLGERLHDGVRREVREECGIEIEIGGLVAAFEPIHWDAEGLVEYHYVVLDYWARHVSGNPSANDDAAEVIWVAPDTIESFQLNSDTAEVIELARRLWASK